MTQTMAAQHNAMAIVDNLASVLFWPSDTIAFAGDEASVLVDAVVDGCDGHDSDPEESDSEDAVAAVAGTGCQVSKTPGGGGGAGNEEDSATVCDEAGAETAGLRVFARPAAATTWGESS